MLKHFKRSICQDGPIVYRGAKLFYQLRNLAANALWSDLIWPVQNVKSGGGRAEQEHRPAAISGLHGQFWAICMLFNTNNYCKH